MPLNKIYIIISQTGTVISRLLKKFTHDEYNHVSISMDPELKTMYSFGRRYYYLPFWGGFIHESPESGVYKRFPDSKVIVLSIEVDDNTFNCIKEQLESMFSLKKYYRYDILGLILAAFNVVYTRENYFYCSAFVKDLLINNGISTNESFNRIVKPMDFMKIPNATVVYSGNLNEMLNI